MRRSPSPHGFCVSPTRGLLAGSVAALVTIGFPLPTAAAQDSATVATALEIIEAARQIAVTDGGRLWGMSLESPLLIADPSTRIAIASVPDSAGYLRPRDGLFVGRLPDEQNVANTGVTWAGRRWTMLVAPWVPRTRYERNRLIAHEIFHRIQPALGLELPEGNTAHLDTRDGRIWLRLEWRALAEGLIRLGDERTRAIEDALAFRRHRRTLFADGADAERRLELNEGLAEYTGLVLSGLPTHVLPDRAAVHLASWDSRSGFVRGFAYASGPAYGALLDELWRLPGSDVRASWRQELASSSDLGAMLARAAGVVVGDEEHDVLLRRAARYDGARVIAEETSRAEQRARRVAELQRTFLDGPTVSLPVMSAFRYSFDPTSAEALEGIGTVYPSVRVTDEWGVLTVTEGGALLLQGDAGITGVLVPAPESADAPVEGRGWRLELGEGWRVVPGDRPGSWRLARS